MLVVSLFMCLFLAGLMYCVLGVGDAILYRQMMQDAADSGAQAAAVMAAKGMNVHALLNVVMAITAGVLLVLRSVEVLLEIVLGILYGLATTVVFSVKAGALIATLSPVEQSVERVADGVEQLTKVSHDTLDAAHDVVQHAFPVAAQLSAVGSIRNETFGAAVRGGMVLPLAGPRLPGGKVGLPVEEGSLGVTCDRVADGLGRRLSTISSRVPNWVRRFLGGVVSRTLSLGKRRTCAEDIVEPPRVSLERGVDDAEVWLGHEEYQYRAYGLGRDPHRARWSKGERGVRVAQGGRAEGRNASWRGHLFGRVNVAQAEYYFDGSEPKAEWMWSQRWRARLRRFRLSEAWLPSGLVKACTNSGAFGANDGLCDSLRDFGVGLVSAH
ncbi:MAG: hypothetical protein AAGF92_06740 [Myxococcota bacterium]